MYQADFSKQFLKAVLSESTRISLKCDIPVKIG